MGSMALAIAAVGGNAGIGGRGMGAGAGAQDSLRRLLAELCTRNPSTTEEGVLTLRDHVEEEARDLTGEAFTRFMDALYDNIQALAESASVADNLGAVHAIDELIDMSLGENATKVARFASYLRRIFEEKGDPDTLAAASAALGHLAAAGGSLTADVVEFQVKQALEWLQGDRVEARRFAAVLVLKEMAENAPTVFNVHVPVFIDAVWSALRDPKPAVRERAVEALRACLCVIEKRETRWRVQGYYRMFEETQKGLAPNASVESIHGSLLAIGELLRNTGEFMMARYKEVVGIVLKYRDHRERLVRRSITALLPRIAHYLRDRFVTSYLKICMDHLMGVIRVPAERDSGFRALGEMASAVKGELLPYVPDMIPLLRDAIGPRRGRPSMEALACVGSLAQWVGPEMAEPVRSLLNVCFAAGLSPTLVDALSKIATHLPTLLPLVQQRLLDMITATLAAKPQRATSSLGLPGVGIPVVRSPSSHSSLGSPPAAHDLSRAALVQIALHTLTIFNFQGHKLLHFASEYVVNFLDNNDVAIRREAATCCCHLLELSCAAAAASSRQVHSAGAGSVRRRRALVEEVLERLLVACVADTDASVRRAVLANLRPDTELDAYMAQADSLRAVFIVLNDEAYEVREKAIKLAGRLADRNPAYVLPALRRHLLQLLVDLEHSTESRMREESARLLGCLIRSSTRLVLPYISPVLKVLVSKLQESTLSGAASASATSGGGTATLISSVLATVGDLAKVGGSGLQPYLGDLMPLIVEALREKGAGGMQDGGAGRKREVAVKTLGELVESTGYVVAPYTDYPALLGLLLDLLEGELPWPTRAAALRVLGIVGALDPHIHKRNLLALQPALNEPARADSGQNTQTHTRGRSLEDVPPELLPPGGLSTASDDYYPTVAIAALMRILRDGKLSSYHQRVVGSLMYIFKAMGLSSVPYLPKVMPDLVHVMRTCEESLREFLFWQLAQLVGIVRQHIRKWLPDLLLLVYDNWSSLLLPVSQRPPAASPVLHLVEQLCVALNDEFRTYLSEVLPRCVSIITEAERSGDYTRVPPVLHTFEVFGGSMEEHMHLLLPALVRLFRPGLSDAPLDIRRAALRTLTRLLPAVQVTGHAATILHPLTRVLDGPQEELRPDAMEAICALAVAQGGDFAIFVPSVRKLLQRHRLQYPRFEHIANQVLRREPVLLGGLPWAALPAPLAPQQIYSGLRATQAGNLAFDGDLETNELDIADGRTLKVNEGNLKKAWESSQRSTKEDWAEWMRHFSVELLKESPSPALRTCAGLAQLQPLVARELFPAGFVSCWSELNPGYQEQLVRSLEAAFASPNIPPEILAILLNLAEFMEHDEKPLPVDIRTLGALAEKCHAFAKALHYKELEFLNCPTDSPDAAVAGVVEALIHVNNQLQQHEAAVGILVYAQQHLHVELKESWYEELQRWEEALAAYKRKATTATSPHALLDATLGRMRCLAALAQWEELSSLCRQAWAPADPVARLEMAPLGASAAWNMGEWDEMTDYVAVLDDGDEHSSARMLHGGVPYGGSGPGVGASDGAFFRAVLSVRRGQYDQARVYVERARKILATDLAALVQESYERAYSDMVRVQQLSELEEVMEYCELSGGGRAGRDAGGDMRMAQMRRTWQTRIRGAQRNVEVWQALLAVRSLVVPPDEDTPTWLKFASLCRKSGRINQSHATLVKLLQYDPELSRTVEESVMPGVVRGGVMLAYLKHMWVLGGDANRRKVLRQLQILASQLSGPQVEAGEAFVATGRVGPGSSSVSGALLAGAGAPVPLVARVYLKLGAWTHKLYPVLTDASIAEIQGSLAIATEAASGWGKAWHTWGQFNTAAMQSLTTRGQMAAAQVHVVAAITGYFRSIALAAAKSPSGDYSLQDILRLLTLWFSHGALLEVQKALQEGFQHVNIDTWLLVIPQIIARIHSNIAPVRNLIQGLLVRIGRNHPQALMFPLLVACKSMSVARRTAAQQVLDNLRTHSPGIVDAAQLVSLELIRVAILWHEMWHEALEEASRLYFGERNVEAMLNVLAPLHAMLETQGPETLKEVSFVQAYGPDLRQANECCMRYRRNGKEAELTTAWDLYYHVFKRINKQLPSLTTLELQYVSPALVEARNLELAVPGTYRAGAPVVTIAGFAPQLLVITSKQRPRRIFIHGNDGAEYTFLLKGHEDLRQDERVMQLFGLVNTLLSNARESAEKDLTIQRYAVVPLSPNSGLIGWVPNCDTLHQLIREYRDARKTPVNVEHRLMLAFAPDYDHLTLMAKVEVFEHALENTPGNDLAKVLWLKSRSSEVWLDRRTNYTRSLAVMSMVGYLLGLGDRHPSNLMLDRYSGKIIHIDFGDCFEASMNREKFPEKVPFRLTRMLEKAMEVSGIEGNFRSTCEKVLHVLRNEKDSITAMMEAFVHDPLINWRLFNITEVTQVPGTLPRTTSTTPTAAAAAVAGAGEETADLLPSPPQRGMRERELLHAVTQLDHANEVLNERAVQVMQRMRNKLTGRDFATPSLQPHPGAAAAGAVEGAEPGLSVKVQVERLIGQARSHENLCQSYIGWCPFW